MTNENLAQTQQDVQKHFPHISASSMPQFLMQVVLKTEKHLPMLVKENDNINEIVALICRIGMMAIKDKTMNQNFIIHSILRTLQDINVMKFISKVSAVVDFLQEVFLSGKHGVFEFSAKTWNFLFASCPSAVELEIIELLKVCSTISLDEEFEKIKSAISQSMLVPACSENHEVFHKVLSVVSHAWFYSEGNSALQYFLGELVKAVEIHCTDYSIVSLFPEHIQHLVMLFSISPTIFKLKDSSTYLWSMVLRSLTLKVCSRNDIILLMGLFPCWYKQLLKEVKEQANGDALQLIKVLWSDMVKELILIQMETLNFD